MTKKQRRELKLWRQLRKGQIMHEARTSDPRHRAYCSQIGAIQDGKYSKRP